MRIEAGRHVRVDELWGARGNQLREQLLAAGGGEAVFRVLESALTARIVDPRPMHPAVAAALASRRGARVPSRVAEIERDAGYSAKHFIALFRAAVGLTPKHYCRVLRFNTAVRCLASAKGENLADLAASAGYADQPHMTREFRDFAGVTPTQYQPRSLSGILHHRVPSASTHAIGGR